MNGQCAGLADRDIIRAASAALAPQDVPELTTLTGPGVTVEEDDGQTGRLEATVPATGHHVEVPEVHEWRLADARATSLTVFLGALELSRTLGRAW